MSPKVMGFSVSYRNTGHWDIYPSSGRRMYRIRGEKGNFIVMDERDYPALGEEPREWGKNTDGFATITAAMAFICGELMEE